ILEIPPVGLIEPDILRREHRIEFHVWQLRDIGRGKGGTIGVGENDEFEMFLEDVQSGEGVRERGPGTDGFAKGAALLFGWGWEIEFGCE
ncbi:MAG: hypothetical protein Q9228_007862, partial [Teloschistes exilis]